MRRLILAAVVVLVALAAGMSVTDSAVSARPSCNNKIDDDNDGKIDYPADPGCDSRGDRDETDVVSPGCSPPLLRPSSVLGLGEITRRIGLQTDMASAIAFGSSDCLTWAPPGYPDYTGYTQLNIQNTGQAIPGHSDTPGFHWVITLDANTDYVLHLDHRQEPWSTSQLQGLSIGGGRNVVIIGGRITFPRPEDPVTERHAFTFHNQTGIVHVEGVLIDGYPNRAFVTNSTQATFQFENIRVEGQQIYNENFDYAHSDTILTWLSPPEIRVDRMTSDYDNTGFAFYGNNCNAVTCATYPAVVKVNRVNFRNTPGNSMMCGTGYYTKGLGGNYIFYAKQTHAEISQFWAETGWGRDSGGGDCPQPGPSQFTLVAGWDIRDGQLAYANTKTLVGDGVSVGSYMYFTNPSADNSFGAGGVGSARVDYGIPPAGDFVPSGVAGSSYVSPGYIP